MNQIKCTGILVIATFLVGCQLGVDLSELTDELRKGQKDTGKHDDNVNNGPLPDGCIKFEGSEIGQDGLTAEFSGISITIDAWTTKEDEKEEFIGFEYTVVGDSVWVSIKAGREIYLEEGQGSWMNPNGIGGLEVKGISNIVFCIDDTNQPT